MRPHLARRVPLHLAFALAFSAAWAILGKIFQAILALLMVPNAWQRATGDLARFESFAARDVTGWILTTLPYGVAIYLAMVGVEHAIRYFVEVREQQVQVARLSKQLADARLAALQAQLNPHFLFNALNTIAVHAREGDGAETARIVERLSDVLRRTLGRHRAGEVPLDDELELVRQYVAIEQARFPDRLTITFDIAPGALPASVPGFVLQHLVENAIRHGVARRSERGTVRVSARRDGESLLLTVEDDGPGFPPSFAIPDGHGLANTRERLRTLYGEGDWLSIRPGADWWHHGTRADPVPRSDGRGFACAPLTSPRSSPTTNRPLGSASASCYAPGPHGAWSPSAATAPRCSRRSSSTARTCSFSTSRCPGIDGFEVVRRRTPEAMPPIVFLTAYEEFALQGLRGAGAGLSREAGDRGTLRPHHAAPRASWSAWCRGDRSPPSHLHPSRDDSRRSRRNRLDRGRR